MPKGWTLRVLVLPPLQDMLSQGRQDAGLTDFREIAVEDLIGRRPVDIHVEEVAGYLTGKQVLVTGAGGSIGSELCRQITAFDPAELIMVDRDETGLQLTQLSITGHGLLNGRDTVLADIRDARALDEIFADSAAPTSSSTPPRSSMCRCWSSTRRRPGRPMSWEPRTCSVPPRRPRSATS